MREPGSPLQIAILVPTHEKVDALWAYDLAQMMAFTTSFMPPDQGHSLGLLMATNTYIHKSRQELLKRALDDGATHVLWLDSDMRFPQHTLLKLLANDVPVCGINYSTRRTPADWVAIKRVPEGDDTEGERLATLEESEGLEEVAIIGFGAVLMEAATLVSLPDPNDIPWFMFGKTEHGADIGEDAWFCLKMLRDVCNERIFVDHDLSKQCAHIGQFEYRLHHAEATQDALAEVRDTEQEG